MDRTKPHPSAAPTRRNFFRLAAAASIAVAAPNLARASASSEALNMTNVHTGEFFKAIVRERGRWIDESVAEFEHFTRDWRAHRAIHMDRRVIGTALQLQALMDCAEPMVLISGYRTPATNRALNGTASRSLHMEGEALDLRQPGRSLSSFHKAAKSLRQGGVGRYSRDNFVHIDCGSVRYWGS